MSQKKEFVKSFFVLSIGVILPSAVQIFTLPIVTGGLSHYEYGLYDLFVSIIAVLLPIATLQLHTAAFRFLLDDKDNIYWRQSIVSNIVFFIILSTIITATILFVFLGSYDMIVRVAVCICLCAETAFRTVQYVARGLGDNKSFSVSAITEACLRFAFFVLTIYVFGFGLIGIIAAMAFSRLIASVILSSKIGFVKCISFKTINMKRFKELFDYSWPMIPNAMAIWVLSSSDKAVLTYFWGAEVNAVYSVATKIPLILATIQSAFTLAWQENASEAMRNGDTKKYYSDMFDAIYSFVLGALGILIACTPVLFALLIHGDYDEAYQYIPYLYIATLFSCMVSFLGGIYVAHKKSFTVGMTTIFGAIINLVIDVILVSKMKIFAAVISTIVSYLFVVIYRMIDVQSFQKMDYPLRKIAISFLIALGMCGLCSCRIMWADLLNAIIGITLFLVVNNQNIKAAMNWIKKRTGKKK